MLDLGCSSFAEGVCFQSYVHVDSDVDTSVSLNDAEMVEAVCCEQLPSEAPPAETYDDWDKSGDEALPPNASDAASGLEMVARYFSYEENSDATLELVNRLQSMLLESRQKKCTQLQIRLS